MAGTNWLRSIGLLSSLQDQKLLPAILKQKQNKQQTELNTVEAMLF
jgi:hypothetical protein